MSSTFDAEFAKISESWGTARWHKILCRWLGAEFSEYLDVYLLAFDSLLSVCCLPPIVCSLLLLAWTTLEKLELGWQGVGGKGF
jgi:hypothetical protein